jgi:hypothetical protein
VSGEIPRYGAYDVWCHRCDRRWRENDEGVIYLHGDGVWECYSEIVCLETAVMTAMTELDAELTGQENTP